LGAREPITDLRAWHADGTRLPFAAQCQYLRSLVLANDLAEGRYQVEGRPIALRKVRVPVFAVGTEDDYVAPWRSVYKIHRHVDSDVTFLLATNGHDDGIVSGPDQPGRSYRLLARPAKAGCLDPEAWLSGARPGAGSWWPEWAAWIDMHSSSPRAPPPLGGSGADAGALRDAPGSYVLES
jgi:polyhydroxyalkanoate synthase